MQQKSILFLATGGGVGRIPFAPGTMGTLVAVPFYVLLSHLSWVHYVLWLFLSFGFGVWLCSAASQYLNADKAILTHDHPSIVWDEIVGFWVTMLAIPCSYGMILIGLFVFRFFDIYKPWPIGWADKTLPGGLGIMFDDILAGVYANILLHIILLIKG